MERNEPNEELICRCEEVSRADVEAAIRAGADSIDAVKKRTRAGMGFCQGRTCRRLVARMLADYYGQSVDRYLPGSLRLPITPVKLSLLAEAEDAPCACGEASEKEAPHA